MAAHSQRGAGAPGYVAQRSNEEHTVAAAARLGFAEDRVEDSHAARPAEHAGLARHLFEAMPRGVQLRRREDDDGGGERFVSRWGNLKSALKHKRWVLAYDAEFARELNAQRGRYLRSAGWCIVLSLLAAMGEV